MPLQVKGAGSRTSLTSDAPGHVRQRHARLRVVEELTPWAAQQLPKYMSSPRTCWQPADLLPNAASPDFYEQVMLLRTAAGNLPNDLLVVLVGGMLTKQAVPGSLSALNAVDVIRDETGGQDHSWARWSRCWAADENRHGDVLSRYLYLSGAVDMSAVNNTLQRLVGAGVDAGVGADPYMMLIFMAFQECILRLFYGNIARLAEYHGDPTASRICAAIASDEGKHAVAYTSIVAQLLWLDPEGCVCVMARLIQQGSMRLPGTSLDDGWHTQANHNRDRPAVTWGAAASLYMDYASVVDAAGVYTLTDHASAVDQLIKTWKVHELRGIRNAEAAAAQEFLCQHAAAVKQLAELQMERRFKNRKAGRSSTANFSWVHRREVSLV
eukprot:jgi/Chrzof1/4026/Cz13g17200.t1_SACPD2[v5.2]